MSKEWEEMEKGVREEVRDRGGDGDGQYFEDTLHEIADSAVPIYYTEIFELAARYPHLRYVSDPGLVAPDADGELDASKVIQVAIYEQLLVVAHEEWEAIKEEAEEEAEEVYATASEARKYLIDVWGYERIEDVDPLTWDCIRENTEEEGSEERYPLDHTLMRAKRIFGDSEDGLRKDGESHGNS